jgi:hypothetical protein
MIESDGVSYEISVCGMKVYLPLIMKSYGLSSPPTTMQTNTPQPNVQITLIFYDGAVPRVESDEYSEITNLGSNSVNLARWRLNAGDPGQDYWFPSFQISPGQSCRVYTDEYHPEHCGLNFGRGSAIWNNSGDCGYLYNSYGTLVDTYCY